jgi:adenylosuccinate synthase
VNGITRIAVTKLDVLDAFDEIRVCVGYEEGGRRLKGFPADSDRLDRVTPVYESFPGWQTPIAECRRVEDLPAEARRYLDALADLTGTALWLVSVGPRRDQTITIS